MILDTCALLWLADESSNRISESVLELINNEAVVYISAISGYEIVTKVGVGKLELLVPPAKWFESVLAFHHIEPIELSLEICQKAAGLPRIHKDPCDRFIIASALMFDLPVVTSDTRFCEYGVQVLL
ncbi:MAG: hypothetical protein VR64_20530 [Desulfatitalea sp. BRH_c12]|nr:MAG: hypothetical protein VR64_20530 [Desulfatitalea sp. BRH_c12]